MLVSINLGFIFGMPVTRNTTSHNSFFFSWGISGIMSPVQNTLQGLGFRV